MRMGIANFQNPVKSAAIPGRKYFVSPDREIQCVILVGAHIERELIW